MQFKLFYVRALLALKLLQKMGSVQYETNKWGFPKFFKLMHDILTFVLEKRIILQ